MLGILFNKVAGRQGCNFIKKQTPTQVLSCEYYEIFKGSYFEKHLRTAASVYSLLKHGQTNMVRYKHEGIIHMTKINILKCF